MLEDGMEVTPCGNTLLVSGFFPPGEKTKVELVVTMSRQEVPRGGTLALKHFDERGELGRVTWRFEPEGDRR
jgi:hypothetical protein